MLSSKIFPHWLGDFVLLSAIWGSSFLFMQWGTRGFGPLPTSGMRVAIAALFLIPLLLHKRQGTQLRKHWKHTFVIGVLNSALPFICFSYALLTISTGLTSIMNATVPLFGAAVAWVWLHERLTITRAIGLLIGFFGVALLAWKKSSVQGAAEQSATALALLACLGACLCYGLAASYTRKYLAGVPSLAAACGSQIGAALALAPLTVLFWPQHSVALNAWIPLIALGVLCSGIAYILYFRIIQRAGPAKALAVTYAIPVFAVLYGVVFLNETVTPWMLVCALIIIFGTVLSTGLFAKRPSTEP
jgi:drug/metabolite transporter (DMT)-like permease